MNYRYMVIYEKRNGELLYRYRTSLPLLEKGKRTSMGWLVKDVKVLDSGKMLSFWDYNNKYNQRFKICRIIKFHYNRILDAIKFTLYLLMIYYLFVK